MAKQTTETTLPRLQFPTFALPQNGVRVLNNRGRQSAVILTAQLPVPTIVGDINASVSFWAELKTTTAGTEYSVSASFDRGVSCPSPETRDAILDHVERHAMRWAHWNQAYDAGHAALTGAGSKRVKLARADEPKPRLVTDARNMVLPTAEAQRRRKATQPAADAADGSQDAAGA